VSFREGDVIEGLYRGKGTKWFKGKVARDNRDGTFDINYDDGDRDLGALPVNMRLLEDARPSSPSRASSVSFREGDVIEGLYRGKGTKWFKGKVARDNRDGTFDINYDDGDRDLGALPVNMRLLEDARPSSPSRAPAVSFREGDVIEGLYRGKGTKWFKGKVARDNRDGTFDINYDDGDRDLGALPVNMRLLEDARPSSPSRASSPGRGAAVSFREGDVIEGLYRGKGTKWFKGKVARDNRDGTFDINYDDGDRDLGALPVNMRLLEDDRSQNVARDDGRSQGRESRVDFDRDRVSDRYDRVSDRESDLRRDDDRRGQSSGSNREALLEESLKQAQDALRMNNAGMGMGALGGMGSMGMGGMGMGGMGMGGMGMGAMGVNPMVGQQILELQTNMSRIANDNAALRSSLSSMARGGPPVQAVSYGRPQSTPFALLENGGGGRARLLDEYEDDLRGSSGFGGGFGGMGSASALESEAVLTEHMRSTLPQGAPRGSLAAYLEHSATGAERANLTDLVRLVEDFEKQRGLAPARRPVEPDGCVTVKLGPTLRVEFRFRTADYA